MVSACVRVIPLYKHVVVFWEFGATASCFLFRKFLVASEIPDFT